MFSDTQLMHQIGTRPQATIVLPRQFNLCILGIEKQFHLNIYDEYDYLSMMWFKLIHVSKGSLCWISRGC